MLPLLTVLAIATSTLDSGTQYRATYQQFLLAKNQYLQNQTAATRISLISKSTQVLQSRNLWQIAYLEYLRQSLANPDLETEVNNLHQFSDQFASATTFEDMNNVSQSWESRLKDSDLLIDVAQLQISSAKLANLQNQLQAYLSDYSASPSTTLNLITSKLQSSISIRQNVDIQLSSYKTSYWSKSTLIDNLKQSHLLLSQAANLLWEITHQK